MGGKAKGGEWVKREGKGRKGRGKEAEGRGKWEKGGGIREYGGRRREKEWMETEGKGRIWREYGWGLIKVLFIIANSSYLHCQVAIKVIPKSNVYSYEEVRDS